MHKSKSLQFSHVRRNFSGRTIPSLANLSEVLFSISHTSHTAVTCPAWFRRSTFGLDFALEAAWHFLAAQFLGSTFWNDSLSSAADDIAILDESFDKPVALVATDEASVDARLAKIVVSTVTGGAMVMSIRHRIITSVTANLPTCGCGLGSWGFLHPQAHGSLP